MEFVRRSESVSERRIGIARAMKFLAERCSVKTLDSSPVAMSGNAGGLFFAISIDPNP